MIRFESKFNSQTASSLLKHNMKKLWWLYLVFSVVFIFIGVANIVDEEPDVVFGAVFVAFGVLFTPLCILLSISMQKKVNKTMSIMSDQTNETYIFDSEGFCIIQTKGEDYRAETHAKYSYFHKVVSTSTHYYLYLSAQQCHVLAKDSLVEGSLADLDGILSNNLASKFVVKK